MIKRSDSGSPSMGVSTALKYEKSNFKMKKNTFETKLK